MALGVFFRFGRLFGPWRVMRASGAILTAVALFATVGSRALALSPTVDTPLEFKNIVSIAKSNVPPQAPNGTRAFTVPAERKFILTDLVISNESDASPAAGQFIAEGADPDCSATLGAARMSPLKVPAGGTLHIPFVTGIRFNAGEIVCIINLDATDQTNWTIRGFLIE